MNIFLEFYMYSFFSVSLHKAHIYISIYALYTSVLYSILYILYILVYMHACIYVVYIHVYLSGEILPLCAFTALPFIIQMS